MSNADDFSTLSRITARPVALNPEVWYPEVGTGKLDFVPSEPEIEPRQCYLCCADETVDCLSPAGMPQSDLLVCERCEGSYRHQQDLKEAWLAEESEV